MYRNSISFAALLFLLFLLASCKFELDGSNFVEVDKTPKSTLNLNDFGQEDTLLVFEKIWLNYNMTVSEGTFYAFKLFINEQEVYTSQKAEGSFFLYEEEFLI